MTPEQRIEHIKALAAAEKAANPAPPIDIDDEEPPVDSATTEPDADAPK